MTVKVSPPYPKHWSEPERTSDICRDCYQVFCKRCKDRKGHHVCATCDRDCCTFCDGIDPYTHMCPDCEDEDEDGEA